MTESNTQTRGNYAPVNGLQMYYEIHGSGDPLVLIHGGYGVIGMFTELLPALAESRQVIAVELQAHGHTADIDRPLRLDLLADDIAALITHLGLDRADVAGFSLGGGVGLQTAIRHPKLVRKLVVISAPAASTGWYPELTAGMAAMSLETQVQMMSDMFMHEVYRQVAPRPEEFPTLVAKTRQLMLIAYDWTADLATITAPTLIVVGDSDFMPLSHAAEMFEKLGGGKTDERGNILSPSQLAVLPGTTHLSILSRTDLLLPILTLFLDAPLQQGS